MNGLKRIKLITSLCRLAAHHCAYMGATCDCKFMHDDDKHIASGSENGSGCPEITIAAAILAHMTEQEFMSFCKRADVNIYYADEERIKVHEVISNFKKERFSDVTTKKNKKTEK